MYLPITFLHRPPARYSFALLNLGALFILCAEQPSEIKGAEVTTQQVRAQCHVGNVVPDDATITAISEGVRGYAVDVKTAEALWKKSEEMVGESF